MSDGNLDERRRRLLTGGLSLTAIGAALLVIGETVSGAVLAAAIVLLLASVVMLGICVGMSAHR